MPTKHKITLKINKNPEIQTPLNISDYKKVKTKLDEECYASEDIATNACIHTCRPTIHRSEPRGKHLQALPCVSVLGLWSYVGDTSEPLIDLDIDRRVQPMCGQLDEEKFLTRALLI